MNFQFCFEILVDFVSKFVDLVLRLEESRHNDEEIEKMTKKYDFFSADPKDAQFNLDSAKLGDRAVTFDLPRHIRSR